jgi:hypothetical protein
MTGYDVSLADQGCPSCGHTADQECPCTCCPEPQTESMNPVITKPGIYSDLAEDIYHADPVPGGSLSASGAKALLDCPAKFRYQQEHPVFKNTFDFGSAAHQLVLGTGPEIVVVDAENWRTKAAQEQQKQARAAGKIPLLTSERDEVVCMASAIRSHPLAAAALDPARGGKPEQSLFMQDETSGVWLRSRLDWMPDPHSAMRPVIFDYKTTKNASPDSFAREMANYRYHLQAAWYAHLYLEITGVDAPFLFIAQDKEPPYLVAVCQPDAEAMRAGRQLMRQAIHAYAACCATGEWPGYGDDIHTISLPPWARAREDQL